MQYIHALYNEQCKRNYVKISLSPAGSWWQASNLEKPHMHFIVQHELQCLKFLLENQTNIIKKKETSKKRGSLYFSCYTKGIIKKHFFFKY